MLDRTATLTTRDPKEQSEPTAAPTGEAPDIFSTKDDYIFQKELEKIRHDELVIC